MDYRNKFSRNLLEKLHKLKTAQIITLSFAGVIFVGGFFLWLPFCTVPGETTSFADALFTATTSVCVTGLVTVTTATHWTAIGKTAILLLIQVGGVGLVSLASVMFIGLHKKISLRNRRLIQESYNLDQMSGLVTVVRKTVLCILGAEGIGAVLYAFCFVPQFGLCKGLIQAVFTAVSAFCNAGIDLLGENSLAPYQGNLLVNLTTMGLIIASGLGFIVWWDLWAKIKKAKKNHKLSVRKVYRTLRLQSKIVLKTTLILVVGGTLLIFLFERNNPHTFVGMSTGRQLLASAFQSVTTRTAGFFTTDQAAFTNATFVLCLVLMIIGGSPMGTAGGIKTTTIAVLVLSIRANLRGDKDVESHNRKIRSSYIRSALVVAGMSLLVLLVMVMLLAAAMPEADLMDIIYELTSAVGTVGLSRGLTPQLNLAGKYIVMLTMYLGRIGPLTLGAAVVARAQHRSENIHLAEEDVMIG